MTVDRKTTHLLAEHVPHSGRLAPAPVQLELQLQTPLLPVELLHGRGVAVEAFRGRVARPDVQLLPLDVDAANRGPLIDEQSTRLVYPRRRRLLRLPAGEREGPVEVAPAGGPGVEVRPHPAEPGGILRLVAARLRHECPLVRVLHVAARLAREVVRAALVTPELDVAGAPGTFGEALVPLEEQIRHVDVGRVPRGQTAVAAACRHIVVIVVDVGGAGDGAGDGDGGDDCGGDGVSRPWRGRGCLSKLPWPKPRTVAGATSRRDDDTARTRSGRTDRGAGGWLAAGGNAARVVRAGTQPRAARR